MKTSRPVLFVSLSAGVFLMAFFGSGIARSIGQGDSWISHLRLAGYSLGLIVISASMFRRLTSQVSDLESKVENLEKKAS